VSICIADILGMVVLKGGVETCRKGRIRDFGVAALVVASLFGVEARMTTVRLSSQTASGERIQDSRRPRSSGHDRLGLSAAKFDRSQTFAPTLATACLL